MKLTLSKIETKAIEGARLFASAKQKDLNAIEHELQALLKRRAETMREVNEHTAEVFDAIAEDAGIEPPPLDKIKFEKKKDGTSVIEWPDAPAAKPKILPKELEGETSEDAHILPPVARNTDTHNLPRIPGETPQEFLDRQKVALDAQIRALKEGLTPEQIAQAEANAREPALAAAE